MVSKTSGCRQVPAEIPLSLTRNIGALDPAEQGILSRARVSVCGCGGLGGQVVENLARAGIGRLILYDPDRFETGNLNRQLGALRTTLGRNKARVLAERAGLIHEVIRAEARCLDFRQDARFGDCDLVVDCLDSAGARRDLARFCADRRLPLVHGAVRQWYGQVATQTGAHARLLALYPDWAGEQQPPPVLACTVSLIGGLQAAETIKLLTGRESALADHWLTVDLTRPEWNLIPWRPPTRTP